MKADSNCWFAEKKLCMVRIQLFLHQKKIGLIQETKNSSYCSVVALTKTERSSRLVVAILIVQCTNYNATHKTSFNFATFVLFLFISWEDKDEESPFLWSYPLVGFIQYPRRPRLVWKSFWDVLHCFFW